MIIYYISCCLLPILLPLYLAYRLEGSGESVGSSLGPAAGSGGGRFLLKLFAFIEREKDKCGYRNRVLHYT